MSWRITIQQVQSEITPGNRVAEPINDWLAKQGRPFRWLLAHTVDGVIWGRLEAGNWQLSSGLISASPPLNHDDLLELRLFGKTGECYLWRDGADLNCRTISDGAGASYNYYDETCILWGTSSEPAGNGFTTLADGSQGLRHAVPFEINMPEDNGRSAKLILRHYIERHSETGLARVKMSRLQALQPIQEEQDGS